MCCGDWRMECTNQVNCLLRFAALVLFKLQFKDFKDDIQRLSRTWPVFKNFQGLENTKKKHSRTFKNFHGPVETLN